MEDELGGDALARAVAANRSLARQIGWGCVVGDRVTPIKELRDFLHLAAGVTEEGLARAIAAWQETALRQRNPDGQLGSATWSRMLKQPSPVLPRPAFAPASWPVVFGGQTLGMLEKIAPFRRCFFTPGGNGACGGASSGAANERGGAIIQLGFRVTNPAAVRRAGFVDAAGQSVFRWIQTVDFVSVPSATSPTGFVRRASQVIDPTALVGAIPDLHPYYWDEETPPGASSDFLIGKFLNRQSQDLTSNRLCYDLIFEDAPAFPLSAATLGRRAYFNFETALVGVRRGNPTRNVVLNTVRWGFDLIVEGKKTDVRVSGPKAGPLGGSAAFRRIMSRDSRAGLFPGHCFVGGGFTGASRCA